MDVSDDLSISRPSYTFSRSVSEFITESQCCHCVSHIRLLLMQLMKEFKLILLLYDNLEKSEMIYVMK